MNKQAVNWCGEMRKRDRQTENMNTTLNPTNKIIVKTWATHYMGNYGNQLREKRGKEREEEGRCYLATEYL